MHRSAAASALGGVAAVLLVTNAFLPPVWLAFGVASPLVCVVYLLVVGLLGAVWHRFMGNRRVRIAADRHGLRIGRAHYTRRAMRAGFVLPPERGLAPRVYLDGEHPMTLEVASVHEGAAIVRALELVDRGRASRYRVSGPIPFGTRAKLLAALGVLVLAAAAVLAGFLVVVLLAFVIGALVHEPILEWLRRRTVDVGSDGVRVDTVGGSRFVPAAELVSVADGDGGVTVLTRGGALRVAESRGLGDDIDRNLELAARIRASIAGRDASSASSEQLLARGDAPVDAWLAALHVRVQEGYRSASLGNDELERALVSASSPTVRVGAAVLLRARGAEPSRLRVAAEAVAEPRLRAALTAVAEGRPQEELEAALAGLDDDAPRTDASS